MYANPNGPRHPYRKVDPAVRFWAKVDASGDCWEWTGARHRFGYGMFQLLGRAITAHSYAYRLLIGPVPSGLELDHLCRNPPCCNPDHLEAVTHAENMHRGHPSQQRKSHCIYGHPLCVRPNGRQRCPTCASNWYRCRRSTS